tara:strand:+ start:232 stop:501 length:270 start_codon:yes stop_codon:yes gene_type:complete
MGRTIKHISRKSRKKPSTKRRSIKEARIQKGSNCKFAMKSSRRLSPPKPLNTIPKNCAAIRIKKTIDVSIVVLCREEERMLIVNFFLEA